LHPEIVVAVIVVAAVLILLTLTLLTVLIVLASSSSSWFWELNVQKLPVRLVPLPSEQLLLLPAQLLSYLPRIIFFFLFIRLRSLLSQEEDDNPGRQKTNIPGMIVVTWLSFYWLFAVAVAVANAISVCAVAAAVCVVGDTVGLWNGMEWNWIESKYTINLWN
jgi:hypothetical protein